MPFAPINPNNVFANAPNFTPINPKVVLSYDPAVPDGKFEISVDCEMPTIVITATPTNSLQNLSLLQAARFTDWAASLTYHWSVTLKFDGGGCPHAIGRGAHTAHTPIAAVTTSNQFKIPFTEVEGGDLTISVVVKGLGFHACATSENLKVVGRNPTAGTIWGSLLAPVSLRFRKLVRQESGGKQFLTDRTDKPYFNISPGDGGVGICQITPPADDAQVWSWKANLKAGADLWNEKKKKSDDYYGDVLNNKAKVKNTNLDSDKFVTFKEMVKAYNDARKKQSAAAKPLDIKLPPLSAEQSEQDTLRGFNGWALGLHEFQVKVDKNGLLAVNVDANGTSGTAEWEQISSDARIGYYKKEELDKKHWGDPDYVKAVEKLPPAF